VTELERADQFIADAISQIRRGMSDVALDDLEQAQISLRSAMRVEEKQNG
jgi:hypothetical protein